MKCYANKGVVENTQGGKSVAVPKALSFSNVSYSYGKKPVLRNVSFSVVQKTALCVVGPSGCGKTTLLRLIAGLLTPHSGTIQLDGQDAAKIPTHRRDIGFVFQGDDALFLHLTVRENVSFAFRHGSRSNRTRQQWSADVNRIINQVGLTPYADERIHRLSGGLKQRVAIARAMVYCPSILLLDEPLSSLDNARKQELLALLLKLKAGSNTLFVYVTHDDREVSAFADHVVVLAKGEVVQQGSLAEIRGAPANGLVKEILGLHDQATGGQA